KGRSLLIDVIEFEATFVPPVILSLAGIVGHLITVTIYAVLILFISWQLGLTLMGLGGLLMLASLLPGGWLGRLSARMSRLNEVLVAQAVGSIQAMRTIRLHGIEAAFGRLFARASGQLAEAQLRLASAQFLVAPPRMVGLMLVFAGFLWEAHRIGA